jgi:hypothetical protein
MVLLESCLQICMTSNIPECTVNELLMMDKENVQKCRVSCQNKFLKLLHLVGFVIKENCYDAGSRERKKKPN